MASEGHLELAQVRAALGAIFEQYPAGNHCDVCAVRVGKVLHEAGFDTSIVTIENEQVPGVPGLRPPLIQARKPDGQLFLLAQTGFHQANRLQVSGMVYYVDALVYQHFGITAVAESVYRGLFEYPDGVEITRIQSVE